MAPLIRDRHRLERSTQVGFTRLAHISSPISGKPEIGVCSAPLRAAPRPGHESAAIRHSCATARRAKYQPAAVGNDRRHRCIVSGLLFTMNAATPTCRAVGARSADRTPRGAPPAFSLSFTGKYRETARRLHGGSGGRTRFPRAGRRDSMPAEGKPRTAMSTQTIIVERRGRVGIVRLNRPQALNALNVTLKDELLSAVEAFDADANVGCILMTGSDKAFAAGADIKEMAGQSYIDIFRADYTADYERLARVRKPIIAAVAGFALGGGCELAMMCDLIIAADNAKFGQPEIKLGVIPGIGGTQRLTRAVGKAKAMDLILTGRMMDAAEAERSGLVARVVPAASLMEEATKVAETIAAMSQPSLLAAKEAVNRSFETSLAEGVRFERRVFHALFATKDQKEGMAAFVEKRPPKFRNE